MFKKVVVHVRSSLKLISIIVIALLLVVCFLAIFYKISYSVSINGTVIGHTDNKSKLQKQINNYIDNGEEANTAYVQIDSLPEYKMCLLKRNIKANDDEIFETIKGEGTTYYRYYTILDNQEEKAYVSTFAEAENVVNTLKEKNSSNVAALTIAEKYDSELQELSTLDDAVSKLYVEQQNVAVASNKKKTSTGTVNTNMTISGGTPVLNVALIKPVSGIKTSRFGERSRIRSSAHTGLDIATSKGTPVVAAASGTVTFAGWKGSYGWLIVITHSNGVQTYYGHCSALYVTAGTKVVQGQRIAAVGSTGNSTGPHLHFEIRVNGVAYNPEKYLY